MISLLRVYNMRVYTTIIYLQAFLFADSFLLRSSENTVLLEKKKTSTVNPQLTRTRDMLKAKKKTVPITT